MTLKLIYEGKSKLVYELDSDRLIIEFKDDVTAGDGAIRAKAPGKDVLCARTSAHLFSLLSSSGIDTHMLEFDGNKRMTVKRLNMIPLEVIVRNAAYGSLLKRMPKFKSLQLFTTPLVEFHYKDDSLHDPLVLPEDVLYAGVLDEEQLELVKEVSLKANRVLYDYLSSKGLLLVDIKFEFGFAKDGSIVLADEISGDTFRVIDEKGRHLDKEIFRKTRDTRALIEAYLELARRLDIRVDDVQALAQQNLRGLYDAE
ncbi:MAG: phosphoribosylaminoimidazolesuccinocarboxamide synthase [Acidilobaceae archaeon]